MESDTADQLGIPVTDLQNALALVAAEYLQDSKYVLDFSVYSKYSNDWLSEMVRSTPGWKSDGQGIHSGSIDHVVGLLRSRMQAGSRILEPSVWSSLVSQEIRQLRKDGLARIILSRGEMVIVLREGTGSLWDIQIDLLAHPKAEPPIYLGRLDLQMDGGSNIAHAQGAGPLQQFLPTAKSWLTLVWDSPRRDTLVENRFWTFGDRALYVDDEAAGSVGLSVDQVHDLLALVGAEVLMAMAVEVRGELIKRLAEGSQAGLEEDESALQTVLGEPAYKRVLEHGEPVTLQNPIGGSISLLPVSETTLSAPRIFLQEGLQVPAGLQSTAAEVVRVGAGLEEVLQVWREQPSDSGDVILFNVEHTPEGPQLSAWLPLVTPLPAVLRGRPETVARMTAEVLAVVAQVARSLGHVLDLETTRVTFLQVGPRTYAILRSA